MNVSKHVLYDINDYKIVFKLILMSRLLCAHKESKQSCRKGLHGEVKLANVVNCCIVFSDLSNKEWIRIFSDAIDENDIIII